MAASRPSSLADALPSAVNLTPNLRSPVLLYKCSPTPAAVNTNPSALVLVLIRMFLEPDPYPYAVT